MRRAGILLALDTDAFMLAFHRLFIVGLGPFLRVSNFTDGWFLPRVHSISGRQMGHGKKGDDHQIGQKVGRRSFGSHIV